MTALAVPARPPSLLPREHGAYAQLAVPLATALWVGGARGPALALALTAILAFLAHEPLLVLLGHRGPRARTALGARARAVLGLEVLGALGCLAAALPGLSSQAALALAAPLGLGLAVLGLAWRRWERSLVGELLAACALSAWSAPLLLASGRSPAAALGLALAFAAAFGLLVAGVRSVIVHHKSAEAAQHLRASGALGSLFTLAGSALAVGAGAAPEAAVLALGPALALAGALCLFPPHPRMLRHIGWASALASLWLGSVLALA